MFQFSNTHAGVCIFVGVRTCPSESLTDHLTSIFASDELKSGQLGLQCALVDLIRKLPVDEAMNKKSIKPQLISTLPVLVDFPPLLKPFKPFLTKKERILAAAGVCVYPFNLIHNSIFIPRSRTQLFLIAATSNSHLFLKTKSTLFQI